MKRSALDDALITALFYVLKHQIQKVWWVRKLKCDCYGGRAETEALFIDDPPSIYLNCSLRKGSKKDRLENLIHELLHGIVIFVGPKTGRSDAVEHAVIAAGERHLYRRLTAKERKRFDRWLSRHAKNGKQP